MTWVLQTFSSSKLKVTLDERWIVLQAEAASSNRGLATILIDPQTRNEAHDLALILRKTARRLEEIGKGL